MRVAVCCGAYVGYWHKASEVRSLNLRPVSGIADIHGRAASARSDVNDPTRRSAARADGEQVVKSFRYLLTDPR